MIEKKFGVKITVVKTEFFEDLVTDVDVSTEDDGQFTRCPFFKVGDVMVVKDVDDLPEHFKCMWAWADIGRDIAMILYGGQPEPVLKNPHSMYSCCDEGLRPVVFKLERVELD